MDLQLNDLSLKQLKDLQAQVARAISSFEDRRKKEAATELEEKARSLGFTLAELAEIATPRKRSVTSAKYANPENPAETWTGRGRKPRWFASAIESGASPESLSI